MTIALRRLWILIALDGECKMKCCGLAGKIFGHKFRKFLLRSTPTIQQINVTEAYPSAINALIEKSIAREYTIRCVRCGKEIDGEKIDGKNWEPPIFYAKSNEELQKHLQMLKEETEKHMGIKLS